MLMLREKNRYTIVYQRLETAEHILFIFLMKQHYFFKNSVYY